MEMLLKYKFQSRLKIPETRVVSWLICRG
jgi:hypothetical protein